MEKLKFTQLWPQWLATAEVCLVYLIVGSCIGWISPFLGNLSRPNPPFEVTKSQTTWIASLTYLGRALGIIFGSLLTNILGSKVTIWIGGIIHAIGWILLIAAQSIHVVFGCLFILGFASGASYPVIAIYVSEIAYTPIRGALMSFSIHGFMVGLLMGNLLGGLLTPWVFGVVNLAIATLFIISYFFVPQTPHYFVSHDKLEDAKMSLQWYSRKADGDQELKKLIIFLNTSPQLSYIATIREIMKPINLKVLLMTSITFGLIELCGILTIIEYSEIIFIKANVTVISPATLVTIMAALSIPGSWISMYTTDKFGRVTMLFLSCIIFFVAIGGWGINFNLLDLGYDNYKFQWIVIISAALFRVSINTGLIPIKMTLIAELYAPNVKSLGSSIVNIIMALCTFISSKNFLSMTEHMTYKYTFYLYAISILIVGICIKLFIPETKGKTLQEIQEMLNNKKQSNHDKDHENNIEDYDINSVKDIPFVCTHL